mgnify:CR=1 FL=1|jgi:hypothetical protein
MSAPKAVSVGTSATLLIAANDSRVYLEIVNMDSAAIFIGEDSTVTISNGIQLGATTSREWERTHGNNEFFYTGTVYAVDASGTSDVRVWERERIR